ncbi:hypothetical protein CDD82_6687 [Ophiocordyceps australis]|uniref:Fe2OG dioxygenase domain-containing protein n=1 Tax=Ophiocordyceps australis TaxID=1399860 RepID=A0A2C5YQZ3_9HYPO|nr:hypothetical protein CDD82_6687 [Ophiocordyceps australis]
MRSTASDKVSIATVDISGYLAGDAEATSQAASQIGQAMQTHGLLYLKGHGFPRHLSAQLFDRVAAFFASPTETKQALHLSNSRAMRGYEQVGDLRINDGQVDIKEAFMLGKEMPKDSAQFLMGPNQWPREDEVPGFRDAVMESFWEMNKVCAAVARLLALSLGLEETFFDGFVSNADSTPWMRAHRYPPAKPEAGFGNRWLGAHSDFGGITLLLQDSVGGLEFFDDSSETWHAVPPVQDSLVMNLGDLFGSPQPLHSFFMFLSATMLTCRVSAAWLERWTNGRYKSMRHRVMSAGGDKHRFSIAFFTMGDLGRVVECLPSCVGAGEKRRYEPIRVEEHLKERFSSTFDAGVYRE